MKNKYDLAGKVIGLAMIIHTEFYLLNILF